MRNKFLLLFLMLIGVNSFAQNGVRAYGYFRESVPGIVPKGNAENGKTLELPGKTEYLIYLVTPSGSVITPVEMYIDGNPYSLHTEKIRTTPVLSPKDKTGKSFPMVPRTTSTVTKLNPTHYVQGKVFSRAQAKARTNQLVVVYKYRGQYYSATLKKLTRLDPDSND